MVTDDLAFLLTSPSTHMQPPFPGEKKKEEQERKERVERILTGVSFPPPGADCADSVGPWTEVHVFFFIQISFSPELMIA